MFGEIGVFLDSWLLRISFHQKKVILTVFLVAVMLYIYKSETTLEYDEMLQSFKEISDLKFLNVEKIPEKSNKTINLLDYEPTKTNSIFLLYTNDVSKGIEITGRQACTVESAAVINPNRQVYILITDEVDYTKYPLNNVTAALLTHSNIHLMYFNPYEMMRGSILEDWFNSSSLPTSEFRIPHLSDIFRLILLRRYGGIYMDLDMIALQDFDTLPENFACIEVWTGAGDIRVANGFLGFNGKLGNKLLDIYLNEIKDNYDPGWYVGNGPIMITRILNNFCNETDNSKLTVEACHGFTVLPKTKCLDITYMEWYDLFDINKTNQTLERLKKNDAVVTHYFTSVSKNHKFPSTDVNAFTTLGTTNCPRVLENVGEFIH